MAEWKVGDVVQLKSGGPVMTVDGIGGSGKCICVWVEKGEPRKATYSPEALQEAPSGQDRPRKALSEP